MSVRIVGKDKSKIRKVTCSGCASMLEYLEKDIHSTMSTDISGQTDTHHHITCPGCNKSIRVSGPGSRSLY